MHIIQEEIGIPKITSEKIGENHSYFTITPLPQGYGMTIGNSLRRVLLSSLPGAAVTAVKIDGVTHEYSTVPGVRDSVLDIMLNLKQLSIKKHSSKPEIVKLHVKKEGPVKASDIQTSSDIEVLNKDYVITTIDKKSELKMDITVEKGVGYISANQRQSDEKDFDLILADVLFSPVKKVRYNVESTRVGQMTDLDKLEMEIMTNGSMTPEDSLKFSANLLKSYFSLFDKKEKPVESDFMTDFTKIASKETEEEDQKKETYTPIEILNFSPRTLNALINAGVGSIEQLIKCTPSKLANFRGFGKKAMDEVAAALETRGLKMSKEE